MINLLITAFGFVLVFGGIYVMYALGFSNPPSISFFFIGLCLSVLGAISVIFFGSQINAGDFQIRTPEKKGSKKKESASKNAGNVMKPKAIPKAINKPEAPKKIEKQASTKKPQETSNVKRSVTSKPNDIIGEKERIPRKIEPKRIPKEPKKGLTITNEESGKPQIAGKQPIITPKKENTSTVTPKTSPENKIKREKPKFTMGKVESVKSSKETEDQFVKNRLNRLKENYIKNAKDIENLIEERLDSFKGTLDQIKSESKDPSIIWSFDAGDVQETMKDIILKADTKILMMYPWVRNVDVSVLKRFMETESKMIIQEASLDDDASVELIKLLMDNNVEIRTMPHVHTVAIVSDAEHGLIISTDPIYESYEVGVIYKDQKSIEEIERMFEEAWNLSKDINLEINA